MIELDDLGKRFGRVTALTSLSATIPGGAVTAFLGPNGAGKTTTIRLIAGLDRPTHGRVRIAGGRLVDAPVPLRTLGVVFDGRAALGSRRCIDHLRWIAEANRLPSERVGVVLRLCGIEAVARRRAGSLSLGTYQRLALATALLGDPDVLVLDEPTNGLDPEGIVWMRQLLRRLADDGRTVFVSSHLISEVAQVADRVLVLGRGRLLADCAMSELAFHAGLVPAVGTRDTPGGADPVLPTLEQAYLALTAPTVEYRADAAPSAES